MKTQLTTNGCKKRIGEESNHIIDLGKKIESTTNEYSTGRK